MKYFLLLTVVAELALRINGLPVPVGQIIKYRVPSKYFNRDETSVGTTSSTAEGSNSLYSILSQIHFGGEKEKVTKIAATTTISSISDDDVNTATSSYEIEDADDMTSTPDPDSEETTDETDDEDVSKEDDFVPDLKVVVEQLEKLVNEYSLAKDATTTTTTMAPTPMDNTEITETVVEATTITSDRGGASAVDESFKKDTTTPSDDSLNIGEVETQVTTTAEPSSETVATLTNEVDNKDEKQQGSTSSDPLLGAVTDLLSSILGLQFEQKLLFQEENNSEPETLDAAKQEIPETEMTTKIPTKLNEIDMMIENLATSVGFATEETPNLETESMSVEEANAMELEKISVEVEEMNRLASIRERINQVMDLVKRTEDEVKAANKKDSQKDDVDDDVVSGTLKEIHSSLGINDESLHDSMVSHPDDKIRNFETTINESLMNKNSNERQDEQVFLPNSAKAALRYKYYDNHDF